MEKTRSTMKRNPADSGQFDPAAYFGKVWELQDEPKLGDPAWGFSTKAMIRDWRKKAERYASEWAGRGDDISAMDDRELARFIRLNLDDRWDSALADWREEQTKMKRNPATMDTETNIIAPEQGPWANVVIQPDWVEPKKVGRTKRNPVNAEGEEESAVPRELLWPITIAVQAYFQSSDPAKRDNAARTIVTNIDSVLERLATFREGGADWIKYLRSLRNWIAGGMVINPTPYSGGKITLAEFEDINTGVGDWPIFMEGNSKLPYMAFSTLPGTTCPGAGACLYGAEKPKDLGGDRILTPTIKDKDGEVIKEGGWCYSFKAWRYPATFRRHVGNTLLLATAEGRAYIASVFAAWANNKGAEAGMNIIRLYVDGDIHDNTTLDFWLDLCAKHPHIQAYGYSKSWAIFRRRQERIDKGIAPMWPANYTVNLSSGASQFKDEIARAQMESLPITREVFAALKIEKDKNGEKIDQNIVTVAGAKAAIERLKASIKGDAMRLRLKRIESVKKSIARATDRGDSAIILNRLNSSLRRAEKMAKKHTPTRKNQLVKLLQKWKRVANEIQAKFNFQDLEKSLKSPIPFAKMSADQQIAYTDELSRYIVAHPKSFTSDYVSRAMSILGRRKMWANKEKTVPLLVTGKSTLFARDCIIAPASYPEEFWMRNPEYTQAMKKAADAVYGFGNYFACPGKCGNCLGNGLHACGERGLKKPIVIGIH